MRAYNLLNERWDDVALKASEGRATRHPASRPGDLGQETAGWLVSPGFIDIQVNGVGSVDFNAPDLTVAGIRQAVDQFVSEGVVRFCPTLITAPTAQIDQIVTVFRQAWESDPRVDQAIWGLHLEGPYLSDLDGPRGAHAREWIRDPRWEEFQGWQRTAGGRIRLITVAPERPGMVEFIRQATASGVVVALGHHAATTDQIGQAVAAGARLTTHFGNGAHAELPRHPNYLWDQLAHPQLALSVIGDGIHLPASVLQVVFRSKPDQVVLISDRVAEPTWSATGSATAIGQPVLVDSGRVALAASPGLLAGALTPFNVALARTASVLGRCPSVIAAATQSPARILGLDRRDLARDWVMFRWTDKEAKIHCVVRDQEIIYLGDDPELMEKP